MYIKRLAPLERELRKHSVLLLGPRRTGKTAFVRNQLPESKVYDLLKADVFLRLSQRPQSIREALGPADQLIVIDEIQKLPKLMDEVHVMIEEFGVRFLLTGSSARKLKRSHTSLMGGRARVRFLHPFVSAELADFDLKRALAFGMLPPIALSDDPREELQNYVGTYLQEEIKAEALSRNIEGFSRFLHQAALWAGEVVNFEAIGRDSQVPARTVREYFTVLEDTLVGKLLKPLKTRGKRKAISHAKCYFFDLGVMQALTGEMDPRPGTTAYGKSLENFIWQELAAYKSYFARDQPLNFWRDIHGAEVDFVLSEKVAIEVKSTVAVHDRHLKGLHQIMEQDDYEIQRRMVVCLEPERRRVGQIEIVPVGKFLQELWSQGLR